MLDKRAGTLQPKSAPSNAGTKQLGKEKLTILTLPLIK
jgi:hypothetical protein